MAEEHAISAAADPSSLDLLDMESRITPTMLVAGTAPLALESMDILLGIGYDTRRDNIILLLQRDNAMKTTRLVRRPGGQANSLPACEVKLPRDTGPDHWISTYRYAFIHVTSSGMVLVAGDAKMCTFDAQHLAPQAEVSTVVNNDPYAARLPTGTVPYDRNGDYVLVSYSSTFAGAYRIALYRIATLELVAQRVLLFGPDAAAPPRQDTFLSPVLGLDATHLYLVPYSVPHSSVSATIGVPLSALRFDGLTRGEAVAREMEPIRVAAAMRGRIALDDGKAAMWTVRGTGVDGVFAAINDRLRVSVSRFGAIVPQCEWLGTSGQDPGTAPSSHLIQLTHMCWRSPTRLIVVRRNVATSEASAVTLLVGFEPWSPKFHVEYAPRNFRASVRMLLWLRHGAADALARGRPIEANSEVAPTQDEVTARVGALVLGDEGPQLWASLPVEVFEVVVGALWSALAAI